MNNKKQSTNRNILWYNWWLIKKVWKYTPSYVILMVFDAVMTGLYHAIGVMYLRELFDGLGNGESFRKVGTIIIGFAIYRLTFYVYNNWHSHIFIPRIKEKLNIELSSEMFKQAVRLDLDRYDTPSFYNDFVWSMDTAFSHAVSLIDDTGRLLNRTAYFAALTGVMFSVDATMALIIFAVSALRIGISYLRNKVYYKYYEEVNPINRKENYVKRVFSLPSYAKDLRISRVKENIFDEYDANVERKKTVVKKYAWFYTSINTVSGLLGYTCEFGLMIFMLYNIMVTGKIGLGGFAVALNASWQMASILHELIDRLLKYHEHGLYIKKMVKFMEYEPKIKGGALEAPAFESLEIKNLGFSYNEEGGNKALDGIDLSIKKGEKIAIVGYNGAGKTTLIKLIMRLYDPTQGQVLYNGRPISEYTIESVRKRLAAVFQDYRIFASTIAENVAGGEYDPAKRQEVLKALEKSTFTEKLNSLEKGIETVLTREFDSNGTELSGGEQQKIAIARALYKNTDLIILDEPSSALDPDAEYELNKAIAEYSDDHTVIFISHRLSTTRHADKIYMFDAGKLIESGTHDELIAKDGKYAYMFNLQAEKYRKNETA